MSRPDDIGFDEPWQAYAFTIARELAAHGLYSPAQWSERLGAKLRASADTGNNAYYRAVLEALESLIVEAGAASVRELAQTKENWRDAYRSTPHGKPVVLRD